MNANPVTILLAISLILAVLSLIKPQWPLLAIAVVLTIVAVWIK